MRGVKWVLMVYFLLLNGCVVGPNYTRPKAALPQSYTSNQHGTLKANTQSQFGGTQHLNTAQDIPAQWWELFHSKPLNDLVMASFEHNPSVGVAKAALHGALENVYAQQGALFPFVGVSFSPTKQQTANILTSVLASNQYDYALYTGQVFVSYSPDVFGGIRRHLESLAAQARVQRLQLEATYLTLASNVVNAAIQEAGLREQINATRNIIASQKKRLDMTHKQHQFGDVAMADIAVQEAAMSASESILLLLEKQLALQRDLLNALTGRFPDDQCTPTFTFDSLKLPTDLPISLPSTLVEHRPDIRAAEEQMHAANALIGVAVSNRLPNVTIGFTNAGTSATHLGSLLQSDTTFWALAGIISQPIFDGGTLLHRQRFAEAMYQEAAAQYRLTVINAFQNVADTLKSIQFDARALHLAGRAAHAAKTSLTISRHQFELGDTSSIALLNNEQLYQQAKLNLIQAQTNRLSDTAALFQALGGGWWRHPLDRVG